MTKTFSGGYRFKRFVGQPKDELVSFGVPNRVIIPLTQGFGMSLEPLVKVGDLVSAGQIIARDDNKVSSPIHSSINGRVVEIKKVNYFKREVAMVVIEGDSSENFKTLEGFNPQWEKLSSEKIEELLYLSGVSSLDREGIPTHFKSSIIMPEEVEDLIIHGASSEVYNASLDVLLKGKNLSNLVEGIKILKKIMPQANVHLVLDKKKKVFIERLKKLTYNLEKFQIDSVVAKYPQGYDEVLVPTILNKKFPYGYSAANIGIVILNIQAVLHVYEAVAEGKPLIDRIIAICGSSFKENIHLKVRVGTPLEFILKDRIKDKSSRLILQSLLTGFDLKDLSLPIDRTFSQIIAIPENRERKFLAFLMPGFKKDSYSRTTLAKLVPLSNKLPDTNQHGEERPCISCGFCDEVCPVGIIPHLLSKYIKRGIIDETLTNYNIFNCIECGLCSYVCPSKIPLLKHMKEGHEKLIMQGCDLNQCILPYFNLKGIEEYRGVTKL